MSLVLRVRRPVSIACVMALAAAFCAFLQPSHLYAQTSQQAAVTLVEPPTPLLPIQFGVWQQQSFAAPVGSTANGSAEALPQNVLREDGFTRSSASTYQRQSSNDTLAIDAYQFVDATGAFAAYTYLRGTHDRPLNGISLGAEVVQQEDKVLLWNGPTVLVATFRGERRFADLAEIVSRLPKAGGPKGLAPLLPMLVPAHNIEPSTLKYALGPESYTAMGGVLPSEIVGFNKSAEVVTAKYRGKGSLTLLLYPTPQIAGEYGRQVEAEMNREGAAAGTVKLRREGPLVLLTTGTWPAAEAQRLVEDIHLRTELTWSKNVPLEFHAEVRKTASLLVSILELSGALMLAAVIMALFFGGGRAMLRVLQGKPAATEPEFLRINLRDSPGEKGSFKPLH